MYRLLTQTSIRCLPYYCLSGLLLVSSGQVRAERADAVVLPEIEVRAERSQLRGQSRLSRENIEQQQADNVASLLDLLPGTAMSGSPRPGGQTLNVWGFGDMEDVKVSVDGAEKNFERYRQGSVFVEPELIKQVTVDKGAFDPARGNGGFGGAVKLETRDASELLQAGRQFGGLLKSGYHSNNEQWQHSGALFVKNRSGTFDVLLYGSWRDGHDLKRPDGSRFPFSANKQQSFLLKANYMPLPEHTVTLSALYGRHNGWEPFAAKRDDISAPSERDIQKYGLDGAWKRKLVYRRQNDQSYSLRYRYTPETNPYLDMTARISYAQTGQHDRRPDNASNGYLGSMGNESESRYSDLRLEFDNVSRFQTGSLKHSLQTGIQLGRHKRDVWMLDRSRLKRADANYGRFQPYYMPAGRQQQYAWYLKDDIRIGNWTFSPALRYDRIRNEGQENWAKMYNTPAAGHDYRSKTYGGWSPFFGINWQAHPNVQLFADISRTWRAPVIDEQYEVQSATSSISGSSRNLQAERITSIRTGSLLNFNNLLHDNDRLQIRATAFKLRGQDEIFKTRGILCAEQAAGGNSSACSRPLANNRNLRGYTVKGWELESYYESDYWFAALGYSAISGKRQGSPRNPWMQGDTWLTDIAPRKATATLGFRVPQAGLNAGWKGEFIRRQDRSPTDGDPEAHYWALPKSKGYALHGLFAAWQPPKVPQLTVRLTIDNLFNRRYAPYLGEAVSGVGRNVKTSVSWQF